MPTEPKKPAALTLRLTLEMRPHAGPTLYADQEVDIGELMRWFRGGVPGARDRLIDVTQGAAAKTMRRALKRIEEADQKTRAQRERIEEADRRTRAQRTP